MSTHHQLLYHIVFSTKNRNPYLTDGFREDVFKYMAGTAKGLEGYPIRVGGYYDHVHLLVRIPAKTSVSTFVGKLKANTSKHFNDTVTTIYKFGWQEGYGAFTVSPSQQGRVVDYIEGQMHHHAVESLENEYLRILKKHEIDFDERYVFD